MLALLLAMIMTLVAPSASATAQQPDVLLLDGKDEAIFTNPLEPFFARHPDLRPPPTITSNWRGYVAVFGVRDGGLWLDRVEVRRHREDAHGDPVGDTVDALATFFPGQQSVFVDWYTGVLVIPRGELVDYVHMGYGSTYERYLLLTIRAGRLVDRQEMTADEFDAHRRRMFEAYKRTPEYAKQLAESMARGSSAENAEGFLYEFTSAEFMARPLEE